MPPSLEIHSRPEIQELLDQIETVDSFLLPSEIEETLEDIIESIESQESSLKAHFVNHEVVHEGTSDTFTSFVLENTECENGATVCFLDGVHTNEFIGGTAVAELMKVTAAHPELIRQLGVKKFVYGHLNPEEMELNERSLLKDEMSVHNYTRKGYRSAKHPDWGVPIDPHDDIRFLESRRGVAILDAYQPDFLFPLHNSGARTGIYINIGPNTSNEVAEEISAFITNAMGASPTEFYESAVEKAPGVYDTSEFNFKYPDGREYKNLGEHLRSINPDSQHFTKEIPYFRLKEDDREATEDNTKEIVAVGRKIEELINQWKEELAELAEEGSYAAKMTDSVRQYTSQSIDKKLEKFKNADFKVSEYRINLVFYPSFMLGHALRAAESVLEDDQRVDIGDRERLLSFENESQTVLSSVVSEYLTPYIEVVDKTRLIRMDLGAMAIAVAQGGSRVAAEAS